MNRLLVVAVELFLFLWVAAFAIRPSNLKLQSRSVARTTRSFSQPSPVSSYEDNRRILTRLVGVTAAGPILFNLIRPRGVNAIGDIYELKGQNAVLQDISFNVQNTYNDAETLSALFQNNCKTIRQSSSASGNVTVLAFGPDTYERSNSFRPGVSSFYEDGGHATITLRSDVVRDDGTVEIFEKGNGLQFIKVGAEVVRLSKSIEKGANIKFAYGWIDLDTPAGVPLEIIVGERRDPVMLACLRVTSLQDTKDFLSSQLGMQELPFPLARLPGSAFEPLQPENSVYMGYSEESMGLLLVRPPPSGKGKGATSTVVISTGNLLRAFTLVYDDSKAASDLPPAIASALSGGPTDISSPDGYHFELKPYSTFKKAATKQVEFNFQN